MIRVAILADMPVGALEQGALGRGGGHAATWLPQLAHAYSSESDLEIHWVILSSRLNAPRTTRLLNQVFHEIPRCSMTVDVLCAYALSRRRLISVLESLSPDVIHVWGSESAYPSVLGWARDCGIPSIMSMQGILTEYNRIGSFSRNWRMRFQSRYERGWVRKASVVTSESQWGLAKVRQMAPLSDGRMVEYGVNAAFYQRKWNPDPDQPVMLYCGGADWRKGFDLLVAALRIAPSPTWSCWIAGGGVTPREASSLPPNVEILGNLSWNALQDRMSAAWGLVLPTRADTSPNAVKEARVIGLPVITSRHGGQAGYILQGQNGVIVDPLTPEGLRQAMDTLLSDFSLTKTMGAARHAEDRDYFRPERTAEGFTAIYRELAEKEQ